jgi:hypothetical protein
MFGATWIFVYFIFLKYCRLFFCFFKLEEIYKKKGKRK